MNPMTFLLTHRKLPAWLAMIVMLLAQVNASAQAQTSTGGLAKARQGLGKFRDEIVLIVPILAVIACVIIGVLYAKDMIRKETMWQWLVGIVIAGSAVELVALFI